MERKLTAILSADVKGYSRLMGDDESEPSAIRSRNETHQIPLRQCRHVGGAAIGPF